MNDTGRFTMPGEAGYESLTLELARKWGADVIRDSDGTTLSDEILDAGYGIYSTVCLIRDHNEWAAAHPHALQQTFLMTQPVAASGRNAHHRAHEGLFRGAVPHQRRRGRHALLAGV